MALIKTLSTSRTFLTLAALAAAVLCAQSSLAQTSTPNGPPATSSKAQRLEWPRTFTGQPDFAFTRDEAVGEARVRSTRENEPMPLAPTLQQLVNDDTLLDPLHINTPLPQVVLDASGTEVSGTEQTSSAPKGQTLMERLMSQAVDLPAVAASAKPDLSEFSTRLSATISSTVANWQPSTDGYNFQGALNSLSLQAIVTSPVKYAVINQQRYTEGETFRITIPMQVPDRVILAAARAQLPVSGTLAPELMEQYKQTYTSILAGFNTRRNQDPTLSQQTLVLPVRITGITARQVLLEMGGKPYALNIRYAY